MVLRSSVEPLGSLQLERTPRCRRARTRGAPLRGAALLGRGRRLASALQLNRWLRLKVLAPVIG